MRSFFTLFIELFKLHPDVEKVYVCDLIKSREEEFQKNVQCPRR